MSSTDSQNQRTIYHPVGFRATLRRVVNLLSGKNETKPLPFSKWSRFSRFFRHIDAGSCNDCEIELAMLASPMYDFERFGLHMVASPCHADALLITGPFTRTMKAPTLAALEVMPSPCWVITVGRVALNDTELAEDDLYSDSYAVISLPQTLKPISLQIKQRVNTSSSTERTQSQPSENHLEERLHEQWNIKHLLRGLVPAILLHIIPTSLWKRTTPVQDRPDLPGAERCPIYPVSSDPPTSDDLLQALLQWRATEHTALLQEDRSNH